MEEAGHDPKHPLDPIARIFDKIAPSAESPNIPDSDTADPESERQSSDCLNPKPPVLTPRENNSPALLLDPKLKVIWQNHPAIVQLWHHTQSVKNGLSAPDILSLLLNTDFQKKVENWRQWVSFFLQLAYRMLSKDELIQHIRLRDTSEQDLLTSMAKQISSEEASALDSECLDQLLNNEKTISYRVAVSEFEEGCYIVFHPYADAPTTQDTKQRREIKQQFEYIKQQQKPFMCTFSILTARLNEADIIQTELLPEEYSQLSNALILKFHDIIEKFGGILEQSDSNGLVAYFFSNHQKDKRMLMIECALNLKSQMGDMSREWKIRKGWLHDIELSIALHCADAFIGTMPTALGDRMLVHGMALFECMQLCRLAAGGQIWATKKFVYQMAPEEQRKLKFGIFRKDNQRQVFVNRSFSRLMDLPFHGLDLTENHIGTGALAVTQIFDHQLL
jgi:hypothetical protein